MKVSIRVSAIMFNYPAIELEPALATRQRHLSSYAHVVHTTPKRVISRHRKKENVFKMSKDEKCTCKACKNIVFHCQICKFVGVLLPSSSWLLPSLGPREELLFLHTKYGNQSSFGSCNFRSTTAVRRSLRQRFLK